MLSDYEIHEIVAQSPESVVFAGEDRAHGKPMAMRRYLMRNDGERSAQDAVDFVEVVARYSGLQTPQVVGLLEAGFDAQDHNPWFVTRMAEGEALMKMLGGAVLAERDAREVATGVLRGLDFLHTRGLVHGGLRTDRIIWSRSGGVCLVDAGMEVALVRLSDYAAAGDPATTAPELRGTRSVAGDFFALGASVYELLTGQARPVADQQGEPGAVSPPAAWLPWLNAMCAVDPAARPVDVAAARALLPSGPTSIGAPRSAPVRVPARTASAAAPPAAAPASPAAAPQPARPAAPAVAQPPSQPAMRPVAAPVSVAAAAPVSQKAVAPATAAAVAGEPAAAGIKRNKSKRPAIWAAAGVALAATAGAGFLAISHQKKNNPGAELAARQAPAAAASTPQPVVNPKPATAGSPATETRTPPATASTGTSTPRPKPPAAAAAAGEFFTPSDNALMIQQRGKRGAIRGIVREVTPSRSRTYIEVIFEGGDCRAVMSAKPNALPDLTGLQALKGKQVEIRGTVVNHPRSRDENPSIKFLAVDDVVPVNP